MKRTWSVEIYNIIVNIILTNETHVLLFYECLAAFRSASDPRRNLLCRFELVISTEDLLVVAVYQLNIIVNPNFNTTRKSCHLVMDNSL